MKKTLLLATMLALIVLTGCSPKKRVSKTIDKDSDEVIKQIVDKNGDEVLAELVTKRSDLFEKDSITIHVRDTIIQTDTIHIEEVSDSANFKRTTGEDSQFILENDDFITTIQISTLQNGDGQKVDWLNVKTTCKGKTIIRNTAVNIDFPVNVTFDKPKPVVIYRTKPWIKWTLGISITLIVFAIAGFFLGVIDWIRSIASR